MTTEAHVPIGFTSKVKQLYPEYQQYAWIVLATVQVLPLFIHVPIGVQLLVNSTVITFLGVVKSVDVEEGQHVKDGDLSPTKRTEITPDGEKEEHVGTKDALMFPITASISLFGLYLVFNYVNKDFVKVLLKIYFSYLGMYALGTFFSGKFLERDPKLSEVTFEKDFGFTIPYVMDEPLKICMRKADNYGFAISFAVAALYCITNHWLLNNIFGITFTIAAIRLIKLGNIKIGLIMLWGLFFYDIFWVFKTDVMVTVAKNVDGPILIKFPLNLAEKKFSMLGLGDMIVPGAFISLLLKFDVDNYLKNFPNARSESIRTPFFWYNILFYFLGITITYIFMIVFNHAQPALLYLVPGATIGFLLPALQLKNWQALQDYEAVIEEKKE